MRPRIMFREGGRVPRVTVVLAMITLVHASMHASDEVQVQTDGVAIVIDRVTGRVQSLVNRVDEAEWAHEPWSIYELAASGEIQTFVDAVATPDGVRLTLELRNAGDAAADVTPTFPVLRLRGSDAEQTRLLRYCFPARSALVGRANASRRALYGGMFPVQFFAADHPTQGAIYAVLQDTTNTRKLFGLDKTDDALRLFARHEQRRLLPGEVWRLPPVLLTARPGTWHEGLAGYRQWLATWYAPAAARQPWFREVFNFRTYYLHAGQPRGTEIFDEATQTMRLHEAVEKDTSAFGGIDFVHLFDWSATPEHGRVGGYQPWEKFGGLDRFNAQLDQLQEQGIASGLYLEGYLVSKHSPSGVALGEQARMLDPQAAEINIWGGPYFTMCPHVPQWQDHLAAICGQLARGTSAKGMYLDEFGFLTQYRCHNADHAADHPPGDHMLNGELAVLRKVRQAVGDRVVLYTEEVPTDVMTQFIDAAYTASVHVAMKEQHAIPINLTRFALPDFKVFELISEHGLGDNVQAVRLCFFNGNGVYLSGDAEKRFAPATLGMIRKTHALLRSHRDAFTSMNPTPLVPTEHDALVANRFPGTDRVVWTLYNSGNTDIACPGLRVPHRPGATYHDVWHDRPIKPVMQAADAVLPVSIRSRDVGFIEQRMPPSPRE